MSDSADPRDQLDRAMLDRAARAALRAAGDAEPNPLVGCVLADASGRVIGVGHHKRCGGAHAEIEALADAARRGESPRAATAWVTLEPCRGVGRTGPCVDALLRAGVREVIYASEDPAPKGVGGADALRAGGCAARRSGASALAIALSAPHSKRTGCGLPWVIAKWAQTPAGGFVADEGRWISGSASLRRVHRLRARVDMVITGVGTVLADDPLLTARAVPRVRRVARRVVLDTHLRTPPGCALARSIDAAPLTIVAGAESITRHAPRAAALRAAGAEVLAAPIGPDARLDAAETLSALAARYTPPTVLLECGPTLLHEFLRRRLVDEAWAFIGGQADAKDTATSVADDHGYHRWIGRRSGEDALVIYGAAGVADSMP